MVDIYSKKKRSAIMKSVRTKNTKPELILRKSLHRLGYRYRLHDRKLPCRPDIVLKKYSTVIFVNGCFWHGHKSCKASVLPKTNTKFWERKILKNKERDRRCEDQLRKQGWTVIVVWECELKTKVLQETITRVCNQISREKS